MNDSEHLARELVGRSEAMVQFRTRLLKLAQTRVSVLLTGETGTGKTTAARLLHELSQRAQGPLVKVNCAGIPDSLLESELFGHERGAFTGALQRRDGLFVQAHGGTLFLDEVGELSPAGQAKLLTALDDGEIRPVGGSRTVAVDLRLLSATSRDLKHGHDEVRFRSDLFHRIAVLHLHIPPLRARRDDVVLLARRELDRVARRHGVPVPRLTPCAIRFLETYDWPGNVRELAHRLEAAVLLFEGDVLKGEGLRDATPQHLATPPLTPGPPHSAQHVPLEGSQEAPIDEGVRRGRYSHFGGVDTERDRILDALSHARGNRTRAAKALGMSRNTLRIRIERLEIRD